MLSLDSSELVIDCELIPNSNQVQSTCFTLEITCDPTSSSFNGQSINKINSSIYSRSQNQLEERMGNLFQNSLVDWLKFYGNNFINR